MNNVHMMSLADMSATMDKSHMADSILFEF